MLQRNHVLKLSLALVTVSALLLGLIACAPPEEPATEPPAPVEEEPVEEEPIEEEPVEPVEPVEEEVDITENEAVYAVASVYPSVDPDLMLTFDHNLGFQVYETLTLWDPDDGVMPNLATSWESNEDGTEWTFYLREGVTFHDGTPFTAEAVKFSYERTIEMGLMAYYLDTVEEMEVVDDHTFRLVLHTPRPMDKVASAGYGMFIVNPNLADKPDGWLEEGNDAGTGPYMIDRYEPGARVEVVRYPDYWRGWEEGQFTRVVYEFVEDTAVREQMIRSGEANVAIGMPWSSYESLAALEGIRVETPQIFYNVNFLLHLSRAPLDDVQVRRALSYSFPYEDVQQAIYGGQATIAQGFVPVGLWDPPADWETYTYDPELARELLEDAGYADGMELKMRVVVGNVEIMEIAQLWQSELAAIGVDVSITEISIGAAWDEMYDPDTEYDIHAFTWAPGWASPYEFTIMFHSANTFAPFMGYDNPEVDSLMMEALAAEALGDLEEANRLHTEVQRILMDEGAAIFVLDVPEFYAFRSDTVGFVANPNYHDVIFWYDLRLE